MLTLKRLLLVVVAVVILLLVLGTLQARLEHDRRVEACMASGSLGAVECEIIVGVLEIDAGR